jgi:predicted ATPase with chaperone activity
MAEARVPTSDDPSKDPDLPPLIKVGDLWCPKAPETFDDVKLEKDALVEMAMKLAGTVARFDTEWAAKQIHLSMPLIRTILNNLSSEGLIEELWQTNEWNTHYRITQQGRDLAVRQMESCSYVGPSPVTLEAYAAMLRWQFATTPQVKPEHVAAALNQMIITKKTAQLAGLAVSSGRSLFVYGPPGNGKSTLGRLIHGALPGDYWIPYAISVGNSVIRVFDTLCHQKIPLDLPNTVDHRWVRIRRPFVVVGGELTIEMLDLIYSPVLRAYESPPHLKSNGGVFLIDDFGRERIEPEQLLNRFITPMEHQVDFFTLRTGQKIQLPLRHLLIFATNLGLETVTDPAFLRRMGYRLYLGAPTEEQYSVIFKAYAQKVGMQVSTELIERLLERYKEQNRELRSCEPRDLIERSRDVCKFQGRPFEITQKILDLAWVGYFGDQPTPVKERATQEA